MERRFCFPALSEAGKTTIARLAPADATLLTDEASYVRKVDGQYFAYGTPFAGELGAPGKNISAPVAALYLLKKAAENRIEEMTRRMRFSASCGTFSFLRISPTWCARCLSRLVPLWQRCRFFSFRSSLTSGFGNS